MALDKVDRSLIKELDVLTTEGRRKAPERVIVQYIAPKRDKGPRYKLRGVNREFIRMNSNNYLSLGNHPEMIKAAEAASYRFGVGPGAVRFIDGTFDYHVQLEERIARFMGKEAAKIFNSAYTSNCGLAIAISTKQTYWVGDELNHNSIIRAMRIANVPKQNKAIYKHGDMDDLNRCMDEAPSEIERVIIIFDGIFSMRGDVAPVAEISRIAETHYDRFKDGVITVVDDSHGVAACGMTGRGVADFEGASSDVIIGTFGKGFGVNGGFVAASQLMVEAVRQKADTYIYTNPLSVADCAAAIKAIDILDSEEGLERLRKLEKRTEQFSDGISSLGLETIVSEHPIVPLLVRDAEETNKMVQHLFENGVLAMGLTFPIVPRGDETIRFQVNADHTKADICHVIKVLSEYVHK